MQVRELIARLLMELWRLPECVASTAALGAADAGPEGPFALFAKAALADLMCAACLGFRLTLNPVSSTLSPQPKP